MGPTLFYGARAEKTPFCHKSERICRLSGDINDAGAHGANRKARRMAAGMPNTAPVVYFTPSRSRYQFILLGEQSTCV